MQARKIVGRACGGAAASRQPGRWRRPWLSARIGAWIVTTEQHLRTLHAWVQLFRPPAWQVAAGTLPLPGAGDWVALPVRCNRQHLRA